MITRIKELIEHYGMSARAFALKCGLKDNTLVNQLNGVREISLTTICKILLSFEDVSAEWLIRGKGEMMLQHEQTQQEADRINKLIDTIAYLQCTITEQRAKIDSLKEENRKMSGQLVMLKNEKRIS